MDITGTASASNTTVPQSPPSTTGKLITILSIAGGGIRDLVPATIIGFLEYKLQELDGPEARIADYFDVIAGTSTAALLTSMLATPDSNNRPLFAARDLDSFFFMNGPKIFPEKKARGPLTLVAKLLGAPKHNDGVFLHHQIKSLMRNVRVADTVTNVVVPAFDVKCQQPVIFSSYEAKHEPLKNACLSDICISTSTYFRTHFFTTTDDDTGQSREYHLVDGAVNDPTIAVLTKEVLRRNPDFNPGSADYRNYLIISVGTGSSNKQVEKYTAPQRAKWGLYNGGFTSIIDIFSHASFGMVDIHAAALFEALQHEKNYLHIQDDCLRESLSEEDHIATIRVKMDSLIRIGQELLKKQVARVNIDTGVYEPVAGEGTNAEALARFAKILSEERKLRQRNLNSD